MEKCPILNSFMPNVLYSRFKNWFNQVPFMVLPRNQQTWTWVLNDLMSRNRKIYPNKQIEFLYIKEYNLMKAYFINAKHEYIVELNVKDYEHKKNS